VVLRYTHVTDKSEAIDNGFAQRLKYEALFTVRNWFNLSWRLYKEMPS